MRRNLCQVVTACLAVMTTAALAGPGLAHGQAMARGRGPEHRQRAPKPTAPPSHRIGGWLELAIRAWQKGDRAAVAHAALAGQAYLEGAEGPAETRRWRVQLHLQDGHTASELGDEVVRRAGGAVAVRGLDLADVWLPLGQVEALLAAEPLIAFAQLPLRPVLLNGPKMSEGAALLRTQPVQCLAADGTGTTVAVLDSGFEGLDNSVASGEVTKLAGVIPQGGGTHGTMCAEVVADVAPGAAILPLRSDTMADLQALAKEVADQGNPRKITVVSHSAIWLGQSFGRHEGKACEATDLVRSAGVAWVNASGNSGNGEFYRFPFVDLDGDGLHEFQPGQEKLLFHQSGWGKLQLTLDWDDYTERKVNLDFELYRQEASGWVAVTTSKMVAGKYIPPMEQLYIADPGGGIYAVQVRAKSAVPKGMKLRIVSMGAGTGAFSVWHKNGNVYDPASCDGVLTVGALAAAAYTQGPLEGYSSYGPTADGRNKPEVVAPTQVTTSVGFFAGTSAACPHVAGAVAVWAAASGKAPETVAQLMRNHAIPMGEALPDQAYGWGRITLPAQELGWDCSPTELPGAQTCATSCGSTGTHLCGADCRFSPCAAPAEVCNSLDDDCDGQTDEALPSCLPASGLDAGSPSDAALETAAADAQAAAGDTPSADASAPPPATALAGGCATAATPGPQRGLWSWLAAVTAVLVLRRRRVLGS